MRLKIKIMNRYMKKSYITPSAQTTEMCFQGIMTGTVTDIGGNGPGYEGGGHGGGFGKDRNEYDEAEELLQNTDGSEETMYSLW